MYQPWKWKQKVPHPESSVRTYKTIPGHNNQRYLWLLFSCVLFNDAVTTQTAEQQIVGWFMNDELERIWKEVTVTYSRYHAGICLEVLRKTTFKIVGGPADTRTEHLANTSLEGYRSGTRMVWA
jgi:hypothetical protein